MVPGASAAVIELERYFADLGDWPKARPEDDRLGMASGQECLHILERICLAQHDRSQVGSIHLQCACR